MAMSVIAVLCVFLLLALLKTLPLALHFTTHVPIYGDTPYHLGWMLAWGAHALATDPGRLFDANVAYPLERSFAFAEHVLGLQPVFAPIYWTTGNPTPGYNLLFVLSFALSGVTAFALARFWTGAAWPALVAGTLFAFAPIRFGHINHVHLLFFVWAPLALLWLEVFLARRRWRDLAAFALCYWLQVLASVYLAFLLTVAVVIHVVWRLLAVERIPADRALLTKGLVFLAASVAVLLPPHLPYVQVRQAWGTPWTIGSLMGGSAEPGDYLRAPPFVNGLYVALSRHLDPRVTEDTMLFPGLLLPALVALGAWGRVGGLEPLRTRRLRMVFGLIAVAAVVLSFGPYLRVAGWNTGIPLPYLALHYLVPGWGAIRIPARFGFLAVLAATPLAALGALRCAEAVAARWRVPVTRVAPLTAGALMALALAETGTAPLPLDETPIARPPAAYRWLATERPGPVLETPLGIEHEMRYLYLSTVHWLPVVSPRGSFAPPVHDELKAVLADLPAARALRYASAIGVKAIVVDTAKLPPEEVARWRTRERLDPALRSLAQLPPHLIYGLAAPPLTTALVAELAVPAWLSAGRPVRLGLVLSSREGTWVHPAPHGRSDAVLEWTPLDGGRSVRHAAAYALPLVVGAGERVQVPLPVSPPAGSGRWRVTLRMPSRGLATEPRSVDIRPVVPRTSVDAVTQLGATYRLEGHDREPAVPALGALELTVDARNTGEAVWLAKAPDNRGEVALRWRWLRDGQEVSRAGRARIRSDVFPGQDYAFVVVAHAPAAPGDCVLEIGLVSEGVASFAQAGTPPLTLRVRVAP